MYWVKPKKGNYNGDYRYGVGFRKPGFERKGLGSNPLDFWSFQALVPSGADNGLLGLGLGRPPEIVRRMKKVAWAVQE